MNSDKKMDEIKRKKTKKDTRTFFTSLSTVTIYNNPCTKNKFLRVSVTALRTTRRLERERRVVPFLVPLVVAVPLDRNERYFWKYADSMT